MTFIKDDKDLFFLRDMSSRDLDNLVEILIGKEDNKRFTEHLTLSDLYKKFQPDHHQYWEKIAEELQLFGGNSFANLFKGGKGVPYREIASDVAKKFGVKVTKSQSIVEIEEAILLEILKKSLSKVKDSDKEDLLKNLDIKHTNLTPEAITAALQLVFKVGGSQSFQLAAIAANATSRALLGSGLTVAGGVATSRAVASLTGPIGWAITGIWTAIDLAGPAYRVTVPAVVEVAFLRKKYQAERDELLAQYEEELKNSNLNVITA